MHVDQPNRDSLALDVMEAVRPSVDTWLYGFLAQKHLLKTRFLRATRWHRAIVIADNVAISCDGALVGGRGCAGGGEGGEEIDGRRRQRRSRIPTPLTEKNRSEGRDVFRRGSRTSRSQRGVHVGSTCPECGKLFQDRTRVFCSVGCWQLHNVSKIIPQLSQKGLAKLAELRSEGRDPAHGGIAGQKRGSLNARRSKERLAWEKRHPELNVENEKQRFQSEILPVISKISIAQIMEITGLSRRYASLIRRGIRTPHPIHYKSLENLEDLT